MNIQPVLPLSVLIPLCLIALGVGIFLSYRSLSKAKSHIRKICVVLRALCLIVLCGCMFNPGGFVSVGDPEPSNWVVMVDVSGSMDVADGEEKRIDNALKVAKELEDIGADRGVGIEVRPFHGVVEAAVDLENGSVNADRNETNLESSAEQLLSEYVAAGKNIGGVLVISDGRQTSLSNLPEFYLRAKAAKAKFHTYTLGEDYPVPDLAVSSSNKMISTFAGQNVTMVGYVQVSNTEKKKLKVELVNQKGEVVETREPLVDESGFASESFSLEAPDASTYYTIRCTPLEDEVRMGNNEVKINVRILESKTRVFIAEGAPYWDSKFLAQLLRNQKYMQVTAAYRLSSDRWFMIDSNQGKPFETNSDIIPRTVEELSKYDLIVLGKNIDGFLTPEMSASLRNYVSEQGGAVLFSRGKAFSSQWSDLKVLEPVNWGEGKFSSFKFIPTSEGETVGLFGQALPSLDSSIWSGLPDLKDAHSVESVKPFTRVLVQGDYNGKKFPLLAVRRYGLGVSSMINADGLWKWDFYPDVKKEVNMYQEFWSQLIQWMVNYSEFLPGYSYSLHTSATEVNPGDRFSIRSRYRGEKDIQRLQFEVTSPELDKPIYVAPARVMGQDGMFEWRTSLNLEKSGEYMVKVVSDDEGPFPELVVTVRAMPNESDELSADPEAMIAFAKKAGGEHLTTANYKEFLEKSVVPNVASVKNGLVQWKSYWLHWITAIILVCLFGAEWWLRRRNGLL